VDKRPSRVSGQSRKYNMVFENREKFEDAETKSYLVSDRSGDDHRRQYGLNAAVTKETLAALAYGQEPYAIVPARTKLIDGRVMVSLHAELLSVVLRFSIFD